jgi:hypothetical protein
MTKSAQITMFLKAIHVFEECGKDLSKENGYMYMYDIWIKYQNYSEFDLIHLVHSRRLLTCECIYFLRTQSIDNALLTVTVAPIPQ